MTIILALALILAHLVIYKLTVALLEANSHGDEIENELTLILNLPM